MTSGAEGTAPGSGRIRGPTPVGALVALAVFVALTVWGLRGRAPDEMYEFAGATMGTSFSVRVDEDLSSRRREAVRDVVEERLDRVSGLMSTYDSASELSRFNQHVSTEPFAVSEELLEVLTMAREVSERSGGAFDVTVAPLVDAWGFGPGALPIGKPDEERLDALRARVGYRRVVLDGAEGTVSKTDPETTVDLSGIAKGYGAESVAAGLLELGLTRFLVEVGGELKAVGTRRDGHAWRVGIERPDPEASGIWGTVDLVDAGIATSGDYRNYFEVDGVRYAHIIDPRTGSPIQLRGASVSVVHPNASMADAWATALTVLGPDEGYELAGREGLAALFVMEANGGLRSLITPALADRFAVGDVDDR